MALQPSIILAGQQPDFVNVLARSDQAAQQKNQFQRENQINNMYQEQGPGILAGDQNSLNALAQFDPAAAMGIQAAQAQQGRLDAAQRRQIETHAMQMGAAQRQQEAAKIESGIMQATQLYQRGDINGINQILQQVGEQPIRSLDEFPALAGRYGDALDVLKSVRDFEAPPKAADEYARYAQEEQAAGRQPLGRIEYAQAKRGKGFSVTTADGTRVTYGGSDQQGALSPSSPLSMISSIDGILNDPALDSSTGILSPLQSIPGTPQRRFGARAAQLEGQAFLQAFQSLKGGGQITEIEGQKAQQAIGRLDTAQSPDDYRAALTELRSILSLGAQRPQGWVEQQRQVIGGQNSIQASDVMSMSPDQIMQLGAEGFRRLPISQLKGLTDEQWDAIEALGAEFE